MRHIEEFVRQIYGDVPAALAGAFTGLTLSETLPSAGLLSVLASILTVLVVNGVKFLINRSDNARIVITERAKIESSAELKVAEIAQAREAAQLEFTRGIIDTMRQEKHDTMGILNLAIGELFKVQMGVKDISDVDISELIEKAKESTKPISVTVIPDGDGSTPK